MRRERWWFFIDWSLTIRYWSIVLSILTVAGLLLWVLTR